jgi:ATP-dependent Clp protease ATP-binding subunit ClpC
VSHHFSDRVRKSLVLAREEAIGFRHEYVGTEHILLGVIHDREGAAAAVLTALSVDPARIRAAVEAAVRPGNVSVERNELPYTSRAKKVLEFAMFEARRFDHGHIGTEHLLLGLIREEKGVASEILASLGVTLENAREETVKRVGVGAEPQPDDEMPRWAEKLGWILGRTFAVLSKIRGRG